MKESGYDTPEELKKAHVIATFSNTIWGQEAWLEAVVHETEVQDRQRSEADLESKNLGENPEPKALRAHFLGLGLDVFNKAVVAVRRTSRELADILADGKLAEILEKLEVDDLSGSKG